MTIPTGTIRQNVMLPASPDLVYDMLIDPVKHAQFTGSPAEGSSDVGGSFTAWDGYISIRNLELKRGALIVQEWSTTEWPEGLPPSRLEINLRAIGQGTDLLLIQTGVPEADLEKYEHGWHEYYWSPLFDFLREQAAQRRKK